MPNRIIKESITTSETLASVSAEAERLFWRLVVLADDYGLYDGRPVTILGKGLTAFLDRFQPKDVERWLVELESVGLIRAYQHEGKPYLQLSTFASHQGQARAKKPKFPYPPASATVCKQTHADTSNVLELVTAPFPITNTNTNTNTEGGMGGTIREPDPQPDSVQEVFEHYRATIQPNARLIPAARDKIRTRLKEYSPAQLQRAVDLFASDPWRMENNSHEGAAWFFHSQERIEKFLAIVPGGRRGAGGNSPPQRRVPIPISEVI